MPADQQPIPPNLREAVEIMARAACRTLYPQLSDADMDKPAKRWNGTALHDADSSVLQDYMPEMETALHALLAQGFSVQRWEPIETAPKDGTSVDLWAQGQRWANKRWGRHDPFSDAPFGPEHWIAVTAPRGEPIGFRYIEPTHWMPLPSPPVGAADER